MKPFLIFTTASLLLVGCATSSRHTEQWEYKVAVPPHQGFSQTQGNRGSTQTQGSKAAEDRRKVREDFLNDMGKDGWILVEKDDLGYYYFKRLKR